MRRVRKVSRKLISSLLVILMLVSLIPVSTSLVNAANTYYYRTSVSSAYEYYASSFDAAWNAAVNNNGVVGIRTNVTCSTKSVPAGKKIVLELNGHVLDRGRTSSSSGKDYNVISVEEGATLTVYGGASASTAPSGSNSVTAWNGSSKYTRTVYSKGVITGGYNTHNGGGINIEKNGTLNLYYTSVTGNRADDAWNTVGGYGGGIALRGNYAKLNMYNSEVAYNYCEVGGGICVRDSEYCTIKMENSYVQYNTATKEGGGIASSGSCSNLKIEGDADRDTSSKSRIYYNKSTNEGGGVYFDDESSVVKNMYIAYNTSSDNGGGVYMPKEKTTVKNCYIYSNTSSKKGGGVYNGNDFNTLSDVNIKYNKATKDGGGVFSYGMGDISLGGKCTIVNNTSTANGTDNLYMDSTINPVQKTYYIKDSLSTGSDIHVRYSSGHPARLTYFPGTYNQAYYTYDNDSSHYFKWYSGDETSPVSGEKTRNIFLVSGSKPTKTSAVTLSPDSGKRTKATGQTVNGYPVVKGVVEFPATANDKGDREGAFYYSDGYFMGNTSYNNHLATMSANLAMAAMYSNVGNDSEPYEYRDKSNNFRQLMSDIGCKDKDIHINDYNVRRPTTSSIGVGIASKKIGDDTLVIIGVRGAGYEAEWASNVSIDQSGEAGGFSYAASLVYSELNKYLKNKGIDGKTAKFWISGYSRAGATSNLVAKRIVDAYDNSGRRTFAYPIEAPKGGLRSEEKSGNNYNCIHNVLNTNDIVPWVAPGEMKFVRYGVDHFVPGNDSSSGSYTPFSGYVDQKADNTITNYEVGSSTYKTQKAKMLNQLKALNDDIVYDDYFHAASINYVSGAAFSRFDFQFIDESSDHTYTPENFIPDFFKKFQAWGFDFNNDSTSNRASSNPTITKGEQVRKNYAGMSVKSSAASTKGSTFQEAVALLCGIVFTMPGEQKAQLMNVTDGIVDRIGISNILSIYTRYINKNFSALSNNNTFYDDCETIWKALTELSTEDEAKGYHSLKEYMSEDELDEIHTALPALLYPLLTYIGYDYKYESQDQAGTLAYNAGRLIQNHYPEVAVSWIRSYDTYYTDSLIGGDDTKPVTIGSANRTTPAKIAAEVKSSAEGTTTTHDGVDSGSKTITVRSLDEVKLVPNNSNYKETGEAIYYRLPKARYGFDQVWHGYDDPFVFGNMSSYYYADGGSGNTYTVEAIATHYDKNTSGSKVNPSNLDGTKRTFVFNVETNSTVAYPSSYTGTFPTGSYHYSTTTIPYGDTYNLQGKKPNNTDTWKFVKWTVYPYKNGGKDGAAIADNLLTTYFGGTFDPTSENTEVTNLTDKDFLFEPSYVKVANSLTVNYSGTENLPDKVSVSELGVSNVPVVWSYDSVSQKFTSTFDVTLPDSVIMEGAVTANISGFDSSKIDNPDFSYNVTNGTARITIVFNCKDNSIVNGYAITVQPYEQNLGQTFDTPVTYNVQKTNGTVQISAPSIANEKFVGWLKVEGISGTETTITIPNQGQKTLITDPVISVPDSVATYNAYYKPIVSEIKLKLDKDVKAGKTMPVKKQASVKVGDEWSIDSTINCAWSPEVINDKADYDTVYSARYSLDLSQGISGSNITNPSQAQTGTSLSGSFEFADEVDVKIVDEDNQNIDVQRTAFGMQGYTVYMDVVFKKTEASKLESFDSEYTLNVPYKSSAKDIEDKLPTSLSAVMNDNSIVELPIDWNAVPSITDSLGGQQLEINGTIVTDLPLAEGLTKSVKTTINILPAPSVKTPVAAPVSGTYSGSTVVTLETEEDATIYYTYTKNTKTENITKIVDGQEVTETITKPDFGNNPTYMEYTAPIDITKLSGFTAGEEIYLSVYADGKTDMNKSANAEFTYKVNALEVESVSSSNATILNSGISKSCYRLRKPNVDENDTSPQAYRYFSDNNGFNELPLSEVLDSAFIDARHIVDEQADTGYNFFKLNNKTEYKGLDLLGVQKRENGSEGNETSDLRFVTAVDSRILRDAFDYGYVITKVNGNINTYKVRDKADALTLENGTKYSCKGVSNNLSGDYGNTVFNREDSGYTDYKYVTARITGINPEAVDYVLLTRFYVICEDGSTMVYATYMNNYDGCAVNYYKLDHPDAEPDSND